MLIKTGSEICTYETPKWTDFYKNLKVVFLICAEGLNHSLNFVKNIYLTTWVNKLDLPYS